MGSVMLSPTLIGGMGTPSSNPTSTSPMAGCKLQYRLSWAVLAALELDTATVRVTSEWWFSNSRTLPLDSLILTTSSVSEVSDRRLGKRLEASGINFE